MASTLTQTQAYIQKEYGWMVGKTVESVREMTAKEVEDFGWYSGSEVPFVVFFTDGSYIIPMQDDEGNGPGALAHAGR